MRRGQIWPQKAKKPGVESELFLASDPYTGMDAALGLILAKEECPASVECHSCCKTPLTTPFRGTPLMRPSARSGGCVPTARWMEHVAQAHG